MGKEFLQSMMPGSENKKQKLNIYDVREYHTEKRVHFVVRMDGGKLKELEKAEGGIEVGMRLKGTVSETNMVLFDSDGKIKKYKNAKDIMLEFGKVRLKMYDVRKKYLIQKLTLEKELLGNRARFIAMIIAKKLHVNNRKKADVVKDLTRLKFRKFGDTTPPRSGFEYLLIMQIVSLTKERKEELERMAKEKAAELEKVKRTSIEKMWTDDLDRLETAINALYVVPDDDATGKGKKRKLSVSSERRNAKTKSRAKSQVQEEEDEEQDDDKETAADLDNPFGDIARWTAGALKPTTDLVSGTKRRRK